MNKPSSSKTLAVAVVCGLAMALSSESSFAAQKSSKHASESIQTSSSAPRSGGGINRVYLGLTTIPTYPGSSGTGVSGLFDLGEGNSVQGIFSIGYVGSFSAGLGGFFRHDIKTSGDSGFHVGGGLTLGLGSSAATVSLATLLAGGGAGVGYSFGLVAAGLGGFHVAIPGTSGNLVAHFDASLGFGFTAGAGGAAFYTGLSALSSALGLSLHYAL